MISLLICADFDEVDVFFAQPAVERDHIRFLRFVA